MLQSALVVLEITATLTALLKLHEFLDFSELREIKPMDDLSHKEMKRRKKHLKINNCCFVFFEEVLLFTYNKQQRCRLWNKYFSNYIFSEIKINTHLMFAVLEKVLQSIHALTTTNWRSCTNIEHLNNCSQAIFGDGEIRGWGGGKSVGGKNIRGRERRQKGRRSGGWRTDSSIQGLNSLLACKEMK